jgi:hypothetical protein
MIFSPLLLTEQASIGHIKRICVCVSIEFKANLPENKNAPTVQLGRFMKELSYRCSIGTNSRNGDPV